MRYDAFISYSHAADGKLAPAMQSALHRFPKPWYRRQALHLFRDQTSLTATPELWPSIQTALDASTYFLLLASPDHATRPELPLGVEPGSATPVTDGGGEAWAATPVRPAEIS